MNVPELSESNVSEVFGAAGVTPTIERESVEFVAARGVLRNREGSLRAFLIMFRR